MGLYDKMKTSPRLEAGGIWLQIDDTRIKLARAGGKNTKFVTAAEKIAREHKRSLNLMSEEQARHLFSKIYAENIVLDWLVQDNEGLLDEDGLPFPENASPADNRWTRGISGPEGEIREFTVENVLATFDDLHDLFTLIKETAEDAALFRQSHLKEIEGN